MFQHDLRGGVVFQHRNFAKWSLTGENQSVPMFRFEAECARFLDEDGNPVKGITTTLETSAK